METMALVRWVPDGRETSSGRLAVSSAPIVAVGEPVLKSGD